MTKVLAPLAALLLLAAPAAAGGYGFDMPNLTWPTEDPAPVAQGCTDLTAPAPSATCRAGE